MIASPSLADSPRARRLPRVAGTPLALGLAMAAALGFASPALADVKAGVDAWTKGDYATAVHEWEGLAAKGDADAQFDLGQAYKKAVRMNDDVWEIEQDRLLKDAKQSSIKAQQVAKAKAAAVSPRSTTPSGKVSNPEDKKDRRSLIADQLGEAMSRRV